MKLFRYITLFLSIVGSLLTGGCSNNVAGGNSGGTEITNGRIVARGGAAAAGVTVAAYPVAFIRGQSAVASVITSETGSDGTFTIGIDSGLYNIFVIDSAGGSGLFVKDVGPKTDLGTLLLDTLGTIAGTVRADVKGTSLVVYSRGTPFRDELYGSDSSFSFTRVPSGTYDVSIAKLPTVGCAPGEDCLPGGGIPSVKEGLTVMPGKSTVIDTLVNTEQLSTLPRGVNGD